MFAKENTVHVKRFTMTKMSIPVTFQKELIDRPNVETMNVIASFADEAPQSVYVFRAISRWSRTGMIRVMFAYSSQNSILQHIDKGCLCGGKIVLRTYGGDHPYYTCENVAKKKCIHRPSFDLKANRITYSVKTLETDLQEESTES